MNGKLYIVATPIGNMEDITLRAIKVLGEVDLVAAEDTRLSGRLLQALGIKKPMISYYEHNKNSRNQQILDTLKSGQNIALISDAGLPAISDPGADLIRQAIDNDIEITVIPGANAALTGLVLSGLDTSRFSFEGFIERKKNSRLAQLQALAAQDKTMIFYESPYRLKTTLSDMMDVFGHDRQAALARELTKLYEQVLRGSLAELNSYFLEHEPKGEFVIIIEKAQPQNIEPPSIDLINSELSMLIEQGNSRKEAAKILAKKYDLSVKHVYDNSLATRCQIRTHPRKN